jgi:hypothetical protein
MIESEEKRKRITDIVTRWANHTKVNQYLRDGDIYGLVDSIITEFYHVNLCCGHWVMHSDDGVPLEFEDYENGEKVTISGNYCKECAKRYKKDFKAREIKS